MWRRVCVSLAVVCVVGVVPVGAVGASEHLGVLEVVRLGGADRYGTSLLVAEGVAADAGGSLEWVVVVSGESWPDAVVASSAAGELGAAVVLTPSGGVRADALGFLARTGVSRALVVSTGDAVSSVVDEQLGAVGVSVERVGGADRYETSVAVARRLGAPGVLGTWGRTVLVASGEVFADALVAGPLSAHGGHPVLLTPRDALHPSVASYLGGSGAVHAVVLGGTAALSAEVSDAVAALGIGVERVAGATRVGTATRTAALTAAQMVSGCPRRAQLGVARADVPFDAFAAGPLLAGRCAALVLSGTGEVPNLTASYINRVRSKNLDGVTLHVFGGNAAIAQTAIDDYLKTTEQPDTGSGSGNSGGGGGNSGSGGSGGGGDSGGGSGGVVGDPPRFYPLLADQTVAENSSLSYWVTAVDDDPEDDIERFELRSHTGYFSIDSYGLLTSHNPLNYEERSRWTLTIAATSGIGNREQSVTGTVTIEVLDSKEAPGAPSKLQVSAATKTSVTITWDEPANTGPSITSYDVQYRGLATGDPWTDPNHSGTGRAITVRGLDQDTSYEFSVKAHNAEGESLWSPSGTVKTLAASEPENNGPSFQSSASVSVDENVSLSHQVTATDLDTQDTVTGYAVFGGADGDLFNISSGGVLTLDTGVTPDYETKSSYEVEVAATSGTGTRERANTQTVTVTVNDVNEPPVFTSSSNVSVHENTELLHQITAVDHDGGDSVVAYTVSGGDDAGSFQFGTRSDFDKLRMRVPLNFEVQRSHEVEVEAISGTGTGRLTSTQTITVTVINDDEPPATPKAPRAPEVTTSSVTIQWDQPANTGPRITGYDVQYKTSSATEWTARSHNGTDRTATVSGLSEGNSYEFQVRARNDEGESDWSPSVTRVPNAAPRITSAASVTVDEGEMLAYQITADDDDSQDSITGYEPIGYDEQLSAHKNKDWFVLGINSSGELWFYGSRGLSGAIDYERLLPPRELEVSVRVTSGTGSRTNSAVYALTVTINDISETIAENFRVTSQGANWIELAWDELADPDVSAEQYRVAVFDSPATSSSIYAEYNVSACCAQRIEGLASGATYDIFLVPIAADRTHLDVLELTASTDAP